MSKFIEVTGPDGHKDIINTKFITNVCQVHISDKKIIEEDSHCILPVNTTLGFHKDFRNYKSAHIVETYEQIKAMLM